MEHRCFRGKLDMMIVTFKRVLLLLNRPHEIDEFIGKDEAVAKTTCNVDDLLVIIPGKRNICRLLDFRH